MTIQSDDSMLDGSDVETEEIYRPGLVFYLATCAALAIPL